MTKLDRRKSIAARVLAVGGDDNLAAQVAGRSARTIRRWKSEREFVALVEAHATGVELPSDELRRALGVPLVAG
jgi:hypothetical protein